MITEQDLSEAQNTVIESVRNGKRFIDFLVLSINKTMIIYKT